MKKDTKYTKGPWEVESNRNKNKDIDIDILSLSGEARMKKLLTPETPHVVAVVRDYAATCGSTHEMELLDQEAIANARLIAASPDLLDIAIKTHDALLHLHICDQDKAYAEELRLNLKNTITKAEGKQIEEIRKCRHTFGYAFDFNDEIVPMPIYEANRETELCEIVQFHYCPTCGANLEEYNHSISNSNSIIFGLRDFNFVFNKKEKIHSPFNYCPNTGREIQTSKLNLC